MEQLRDGIAQRDAQIRDLHSLLHFRATAAERAEAAEAKLGALQHNATSGGEPAPGAAAVPTRRRSAGEELLWHRAVAKAADAAAAERDTCERGFQRGFSGAERDTAALAIAAVDAVRAGREMVAQAFEEGSHAVAMCTRKLEAAQAKARELKAALSRSEEEARRARRGEAAAVARLQAALAQQLQQQQGHHLAAAALAAPHPQPRPSAARDSSPFSFRPAEVSPSAAAPASKAGRGPVHVQLSVGVGARGVAPGQAGVLVSLLVDWAVCPTWESAQDQLQGALAHTHFSPRS